jgi:hexosaminidase
MSVCRLTCSDDIGTLLPKPSGKLRFSKTTTALNYFEITQQLNITTQSIVSAWQESWVRFQLFQYRKISIPATQLKVGKKLRVSVYLSSNEFLLNHATDESYKLTITYDVDQVNVEISSINYFGARHALETLDQLIVFDDFKDELVILDDVEIEDAPKYKHRGISMDTSRNYYTVEDIKRVIDGLAMVKLNVYHWHISDAQAMPLDLISRPELTKLGAYSPDKVYTAENIKEIVHHAKVRGVRVIPEFDTPSHVGEGWQNTNLTICYKGKGLIFP